MAKNKKIKSGFMDTMAIHAGESREKYADSLTTPIVQTSTFTFKNIKDIEAYTKKEKERFEYARYGNPTEKIAEKLSDNPIWIKGVGWCTDTPNLDMKDWSKSVDTRLAADMAYKTAKIHNPRKDVDLAEVNDLFAYKELQHMEALKLCDYGEAGRLTEEGATTRSGETPVNASGGLLGMGYGLEASGLEKLLEIVLQLRGDAGRRQISDVEVGLAHAWRGIPTSTSIAAVLSNNK